MLTQHVFLLREWDCVSNLEMMLQLKRNFMLPDYFANERVEIMLKRIDHIAFTVKDREKTIQFYEQNLGFRKYAETEVPPPVLKIVYLKLGDSVLELIQKDNSIVSQGFHFCLESDHFDDDLPPIYGSGAMLGDESF